MPEDKKLRNLLTAVIGGTDGVDGFFEGEALSLTYSGAPTVSLELNEDGGLFAFRLFTPARDSGSPGSGTGSRPSRSGTEPSGLS